MPHVLGCHVPRLSSASTSERVCSGGERRASRKVALLDHERRVRTQKRVDLVRSCEQTTSSTGNSTILEASPIMRNGRTLVPIRTIIEALRGTVGWDGTARKRVMTLGGSSISLWIGRGSATGNGVTMPVDSTNPKVVPEVINSRTMLPLRFVSEHLGATIEWKRSTQTIPISHLS